MKVKLGELIKIRTGKLDANAASENGEYPFFTCSKEPLRISTYSYDCECVLVAGNGDLNAKYYNGKFDAYQRTYIIESNGDGRLHLPYLYYFMTRYIQELRKLSIGGVIKYIKLGNLTDAEIALPSIKEQKDACEKLEKIKNIIDKKEAQISYLDNLIKARFVEMSESNNSFDKLGNLAHFIKTGKLDANAEEKGGLYPFFTCDATPKTINTYAFDMEAILISGNGSRVGHVHYYSGKFNAYQRTYVIGDFNKNIDVVFLKKYLEMELRPYISKNKKGSAVPYITLPMLQNFAVPVPKIEYQKQFAAFVAQVDKSKFALSNELAMGNFYVRLIYDRIMHGCIDLRMAQ